MKIAHFNPKTASTSHEGTILADRVIPEGMHEPFEHLYGYLENSRSMLGHKHPTDEIYLVFSGSGYTMIGGQNIAVKPGDILVVPPNVYHTQLCTDRDEAPYLWAAFWWPHIEGNAPFGDEIVRSRFDIKHAKPAHNGTLLAAPAVPPQAKTPFSHAYGYLEKGKPMEGHAHAAEEVYIIFKGHGMMTVGEEKAQVSAGDVIGIPSGSYHDLTADSEELLFAAFWWDL